MKTWHGSSPKIQFGCLKEQHNNNTNQNVYEFW